jgi:hypothetical protein
MAHTITASNGAGSTTPLAVSEYSSSMSSRTVYHDTLDGGLGQSWVPPRPRSGTLTLTYATEAAANAARLLHAQSPTYLWATDALTTVPMTYGVDGSIDLSYDAGSKVWTLTVGFQEVPA